MIFNLSFFATSISQAKECLRHAHAPEIVKALVESALDRIHAPRQASGAGAGQASATEAESAGPTNPAPKAPTFVGVLVEAWGNFDESGTGASEIARFLVRPLFAS